MHEVLQQKRSPKLRNKCIRCRTRVGLYSSGMVCGSNKGHRTQKNKTVKIRYLNIGSCSEKNIWLNKQETKQTDVVLNEITETLIRLFIEVVGVFTQMRKMVESQQYSS